MIQCSSKLDNKSMELAVIGGLFSIVKAMRDNEWQKVLSVLEEQRVILARIDSRWNDER